ncbi:MAG TPA: hypothetical protein VLS96_01375 [Nodosilinea sp.]|nr:hypothetical protein [Nodosilinea sp.]
MQFLINDDGEKTAVLLDLQEWGDLWEDFHDILVSRARAQEATVSWSELETELDSESSTHGTL